MDITFRGLEPSDKVRERAEKKFRKVGKHLKEPVEVHLVLSQEKRHYKAELTLRSAGESPFSAREVTDDAFSAIDVLMHKVERAMRRNRERALDRQQTPGDMPDESPAVDDSASDDAAEDLVL